MSSWIDMHIFRCFSVKAFFILLCIGSLTVPVSADQVSFATQPEQIPLSLVDNASVSGVSPVNPGTLIPGGQYAGKMQPVVLVVPVKKEQKSLRPSTIQSSHTIGKVRIMKGSLPDTRNTTGLSPDTTSNLPTVEILDQNDTVLYVKNFAYQNLMTVPMNMPGQPEDQVPSLIAISPETTVVLPSLEGARKIRVVDENGQAGDIIDLEGAPITDLVSGTPDHLAASSPVNPGSFNVLILASGYSPSTISSFTAKADLVKQQILHSAPFTSYGPALSVNIYADTQDLGCSPGCNGIDRLMCCNSSTVMSVAQDSGSLYDEIIVIDNTATYAGGGMRDSGTAAYKTNSYSSYCQVYDGPYTVPMALHEFGHSFGDLCDEYSYGSEGYTYSPCVNCRASCSDWSPYSGICTLGCDAKSAYFRPERSIMLDLSSPTIYNQASIKADYSPDGLEKRLNFFMGVPLAAPVAAFTGTPLTSTAPLDVTFTDASRGTSITNRRWDFGDGNISSYAGSTNPVHRYTSAGTYTLNLTVTNAGGSTSLKRTNYITLTAPLAAPIAAFTGTPLTSTAPLDVTFTDASSGTSITNRRWDFGDGNISSYAGSTNPSHRYTSAGTYTVNLTVTNAGGSTSLKRTNYISVTAPPLAPLAAFTSNVQTGSTPLAVQFTSQSTGTAPLTYAWDFTNDGTVESTARDPSYNFGAAGMYTVKLTVTNGAGSDNEIKTNYVTVNPAPVTRVNNSTWIGIYRTSISTWYLDTNNDGIINRTIHFGIPGDIPVAGDWNGDGSTDAGIFRPATGYWYFDYNLDGIVDTSFRYGGSGDQIITGDWLGTGKDGIAIFRPATGYWYFDYNLDGIVDKSFRYGGSGDQIITGTSA